MDRRSRTGLYLSGLAVLVAAGCTEAPTEPASAIGLEGVESQEAAFGMGQSSDRCVNVVYEGVFELGAPVFIPVPPYAGLGALPRPVTLGPYAGMLSSVVTSPPGDPTRADHVTLVHYFETDGGAFWTDDRAVCAPAGQDAMSCRLNDVMVVVGGSGIFANANGKIRNQGTITFYAVPIEGPSGLVVGSLGSNLRGRVCGDGI
jgi:hypothetical protein